MTDAPEDDPDLLAGEYVLGALDPDAVRQVEARRASDPDFAAKLRWWEQRLAPLARTVTPAAPPVDLWSRIAADIGPAKPSAIPSASRQSARPPPPRRGALRAWQAATGLSLALAAGLAAFIVVERGRAPQLLGAIQVADAPQGGFIAEVQRNGTALIRPVAQISVAANHDLELWSLPQGATRPTSLGVLPKEGKRLALEQLPAPGTQLMVSLEPPGGSPTGLPTGPVLYAGRLTGLN